MPWTNLPLTTGTGISTYAFVKQFWQAVQERAWATGATVWPQGNFAWGTGTVTGIASNGDGTYTITDSGASWGTNRWFGYTPPSTSPYIPSNYDLIIDDPFDETQCVHVSIEGNTATTFKVSGSAIDDAITSKFLASTGALVGRTYYIIKQFGEWWSERWLVWPNDQEAWVGTGLSAGAIVPIRQLTSTGTTATATLASGHGFVNGDSVTIAGATSTASRYNGTFTISAVTSTSFQYTLAAADISPATGSPTATTPLNGAYDASAAYPAGKFATGFELMVKGSDNLLHRLTLTGNDGKNLYFARQTVTVSGQYGIVATGGRWRIYNSGVSPAASTDNSPYAGPPFRWYHSLWDHYASHLPDDSLGSTPAPKTSLTLYNGTGCSTPYNVSVFDQDVWTAIDDMCNGPDKNFTPDLFRTIHALQLAIEGLSTYYVKVQNYEGAAAIPTFVPATLFLAAGVNAFSTTSGTVGTDSHGHAGISFSAITLPTAAANILSLTGSIPVYFALLDDTGTVQHSGTSTLTSSSFLTGSFQSCVGISPPTWCDEGRTLILSLGFTRKYPNEFAYLYDRTAFIPDVDTSGSSAVFADPPSTSYPGRYATRPKSTKYKEHDQIGIVREANAYRPFVANDFARYSGDNANDPTIHTAYAGTTVTGNSEINTGSAPVPDPSSYFDNYFEGTLSHSNQSALSALRGGTSTGGDAYSLQDTGKNWWPGGVLRTETGTASGGSTTSLTDSSKAGNAFWNAGTGRWAGFTVEVQIAGTWYPRLIATMSGTTLTWADPLPVSANGLPYRIREPKYVLNRWAGRRLTVTLPNGGGTYNIPITGNDDHNLYFAQQTFSIPAGASYIIQESYPGGVWQWDATHSKWIVPTGNDTRSGSAVPWLANQNCNLPTYTTNYGRFMKGDYICFDLFNELYAVLNQMVWTKVNVTWTSRANPAVCERNFNNPPGFGGSAPNQGAAYTGFTDSTSGTHYEGAIEYFNQDYWTDPSPSGCNLANSNPPYNVPDGAKDYAIDQAGAPEAIAVGDNGNACCYSYRLTRRYAYGSVTNIPTLQDSTVDFFVHATTVNGPPSPPCGTSSASTGNVFDANGDGVLYNAWHKWDSQGPAQTSSRLSVKLGSANPPNPAGDGSRDCTTSYCQDTSGYQADAVAAIIKWDVASGFRKYTI